MKAKVQAYCSLSKPRIVTMILVTTAIGYFFGAHGIPSYLHLFLTLLGTGLCCAGAAVLNCYLERDIDKKMKRTMRRPLPAGEVAPAEALGVGIVLVLAGTLFLAWKINLLTGFLALLTAFLYVLIYTPLKRVTWLNTLIGAIPGALPPMGGWAAATGDLSLGAWVLFLILFFWQHPHFYAIAWMYREDYLRGGLKMLPCVEPDGNSTFRQILWFSVLLIPISLLPTFMGMSGYLYFYGALLLGLALLAAGVVVARSRSVADAKQLLRASVIYLPLLLILIVTDAGF
ncbi:MAG: heme o synthase [Deltaproteobacteria bacterium]|nr:heme o synthase [Deltaproteobacteria bacterium]